jgi:hypothetical protein
VCISFSCLDFVNNAFIDNQLRMAFYQYMLHPEMTPEIPFPWLPHCKDSQVQRLLEFYRVPLTTPDDPMQWWLECNVPGFSLRWKELSQSEWMWLYEHEPHLFHKPWLPMARIEYWE